MRLLYRIAFALVANVSALFAIPQLINYQGQLTRPDGTPLDTTVAITFRMYGVSGGGAAIWTEAHPSVVVTDGLFQIFLGSVTPLPDAFAVNRWLGVTIGSNAEMAPRQQFVSVAHAYRVGTIDGARGGYITGDTYVAGDLHVGDSNTGGNLYGLLVGSDHSISGDRSSITGGADNHISSQYSHIGAGTDNYANGNMSVIGGGASNVIHPMSDFGIIGGGALNVIDSVQHATIGGGQGNWVFGQHGAVTGGRLNSAATEGFVGGGVGNRCWGNTCVIAGGDSNLIDGGSLNSILGGGGNSIDAVSFSTVGGGLANAVGADYGFVGGGFYNSTAAEAAVVSGGMYQSASGLHSTVCGGYNNTASGTEAVIAGGNSNTASGYRSFVAGGGNNEASHNFCFAGGNNAHAIHSGSFVWGDGWGTNLTSSANDQFSVRASGGYRLYSNNSHTAGVTLAAGGNAWVAVSDSTKKRDIRLSNTKTILDKVAAFPVKEWEYKSEAAGTEHIGPMAQDFWNAFHLGSDSLGIETIDADGVLFAAVQELAKRVIELQAEVQSLNAQKQQSFTR